MSTFYEDRLRYTTPLYILPVEKAEEFREECPYFNGETLEKIIRLIYQQGSSEKEEELVCQCEPYCNRSIGDIWRHVKVFFPEVTLEKTMNTLYQALVKGECTIGTLYCDDIFKRVFYPVSKYSFDTSEYHTIKDEFELTLPEWEFVKGEN